jgi:tellurite resistance protein TehA-like permease
VLQDAQDPTRAFGFFTIVAAINVVGVRLYSPEAPWLTVALALISVPVWLLLSYGVPGIMMLRPRLTPVSGELNGSWFLWVVGTQSLAVAAAAIGRDAPSAPLADVAVALWGVGVILYLMLTTLITLRLLTTRNDAHSLGPSYWIYMGATAITVLAGSAILLMPKDLPVLVATAAVVSGLTYVLWAFGMWWIPLLILFGFWRHVLQHEPERYEYGLWSIVFPLGMYSVASMHLGAEARLPLVTAIGNFGTFLAGLAWLAVTIAMLAALRSPRDRTLR